MYDKRHNTNRELALARSRGRRLQCASCGKPIWERRSYGLWCGDCYERIMRGMNRGHAVDKPEREKRVAYYAARAAAGLPLFDEPSRNPPKEM